MAKAKSNIDILDITARLNNLNDIFEVTTKPMIFDADIGGTIEYFESTVRTLERLGVSAVIIQSESYLNKNPSLNVYGSDHSVDALNVALINKNNLNVNNFSLVHADWLSSFKKASFDLIVTNPPYIADQDPHLENLQHEPNKALVAKDNGLRDIRLIIEQSTEVLKRGGLLILEHGYQQQEEVENIFKKNHFSNVSNLKDFQELPRITLGTF